MKKSLLLLVLLFALVSSDDDTNKIVLRKGANTYYLDMNSDAYKNLQKENQGMPVSNKGFFIGRLEKVSIPDSNPASGTLSIKIKKED